jgi:hypothetical protein
VHGAFLLASPLRQTPVSFFLVGDSIAYLREAWRVAEGLPRAVGDLPYHPPFTSWLLVPLWWVLGSAPRVSLAAKLVMAAFSGATYAVFYRQVKDRLPGALPICLALPLSFGELALNSAVASEVVYRLLLVLLVALGWRRPWAAGLFHGAAALTRPEHLPVALLLGVFAVWRWPARRPFVARAAAGAALLLLPATALTARSLSAYNREHRSELPRPLPTLVPVSFYGPLNFALAQQEEGIHVSRRSLPEAPAGPDLLDPTFAPHNELITRGYALGLSEIGRRPGRFLRRTVAKLGHSARALAYGWTGRDLPKGGPWLRQPVDAAFAASPPWTALCLALTAVGAWSLRREKVFLAVGFGLLAYRLAINALFFPYLRGVMVVAPFYLALQAGGLACLVRRSARWALPALVGALALCHLATVRSGRYERSGERGEDGEILDDRPVVIERLAGAPREPP